VSTDHHSDYMARALAALTPEGRARVDELLDELAEAVGGRQWLARFASVRRTEADLGHTDPGAGPEPGDMLSKEELDGLMTGFTVIRDQEPLDDVGDWANAVIMLLEDEAARYGEL
jgi:hypothetical protein